MDSAWLIGRSAEVRTVHFARHVGAETWRRSKLARLNSSALVAGVGRREQGNPTSYEATFTC
jgi:hypothetical protein